jgi:hypothetical protein
VGRCPCRDAVGSRADRRGVRDFFGTTTPFDASTLTALYPGGRDDYLARFTDALDETIAAGFVLADDRDEILAVAAASYPSGD